MTNINEIKQVGAASAYTYVEMKCIGDEADYVVGKDGTVWMVPGSEKGRDQFGRKVRS